MTTIRQLAEELNMTTSELREWAPNDITRDMSDTDEISEEDANELRKHSNDGTW